MLMASNIPSLDEIVVKFEKISARKLVTADKQYLADLMKDKGFSNWLELTLQALEKCKDTWAKSFTYDISMVDQRGWYAQRWKAQISEHLNTDWTWLIWGFITKEEAVSKFKDVKCAVVRFSITYPGFFVVTTAEEEILCTIGNDGIVLEYAGVVIEHVDIFVLLAKKGKEHLLDPVAGKHIKFGFHRNGGREESEVLENKSSPFNGLIP